MPEDLSVVGFDNIPESALTDPPLTTVDQSIQALGHEQAFVSQLAETDPAQKRKLMIDLYKRVVDGVADLGFPLSIHLEAAYGTSAPAFETFAEMLDYWSPDKG